jgi:hypothetical protein
MKICMIQHLMAGELSKGKRPAFAAGVKAASELMWTLKDAPIADVRRRLAKHLFTLGVPRFAKRRMAVALLPLGRATFLGRYRGQSRP